MKLGIAFQLLQGLGDSWLAGFSVLENYIGALRAAEGDNVSVSLAVSQNVELPSATLLPRVDQVIRYPVIPHHSLAWFADFGSHFLFRTELAADRALKQANVQILFTGIPVRRTTLPTLALISDMQHHHLPHFFDAHERASRDASFRQAMQRAARVIGFSKAVRADFERFAPEFASKVCVLPPEPIIPPEIYENVPRRVLEQYALPDKFFYLPNQLWQHKNHLAVIEAVSLLNARGVRVNVVCTGTPGDYRNMSFAGGVLRKISELGVRDQIILLGAVPRADVFELYRQSICVLNPSLFEGYGFAAAEGRAIGKRILVSDLPAHRELNAPCAEYFDPKNIGALADKMENIWRTTNPGPDAALEAQARVLQPQRVRDVGEQFFTIARQLAKS